jgi:N-ethylmaleimide reductase
MTHRAFEPAQLGPITLANHIVMAPMTRSRALGSVPNDMMAEYYRQRAGAGLIVTEGTSPAPEGLGYARIPGLFTAEQVAGWRLVTEAVHGAGGRIFVQIMHTGRIFHELNLPEGAEGLAPSAIAAPGEIWTDQAQMKPHGSPRALAPEELTRVRDEFAHSAELAIQAGFDGVELHAANGYLLEQFLSPEANRRTDSYGGSVANRARFVIEVARAVADRIGAERTGIRLSPWGRNGGLTHYDEIDETYVYLATELQAIGLVYVHLVNQADPALAANTARTASAVRGVFTNTLILNGNFHTVDAIDDVLASGRADLVAIGRPFLSNPDLVQRLRTDAPLAAPQPATFFSPGPGGFADGYTNYPAATDSTSNAA